MKKARKKIVAANGGGLWPLRFTLNGKKVSAKVQPTQTLLDFLRIEMGLTGTKGACLEGECGSCTCWWTADR